TALYDHTSVEALTHYVVGVFGARLQDDAAALRPLPAPTAPRVASASSRNEVSVSERAVTGSPLRPDAIAVIGMSGQFPAAPDIAHFRGNLVGGRGGIGGVGGGGSDGFRWGGVLAGRDAFDPLFFPLSPREAAAMNRHQRLVLQESWRSIEDAACNPR